MPVFGAYFVTRAAGSSGGNLWPIQTCTHRGMSSHTPHCRAPGLQRASLKVTVTQVLSLLFLCTGPPAEPKSGGRMRAGPWSRTGRPGCQELPRAGWRGRRGSEEQGCCGQGWDSPFRSRDKTELGTPGCGRGSHGWAPRESGTPSSGGAAQDCTPFVSPAWSLGGGCPWRDSIHTQISVTLLQGPGRAGLSSGVMCSWAGGWVAAHDARDPECQAHPQRPG